MSKYPSVPPNHPARFTPSPATTAPPRRRLLSSKQAGEYLGISSNSIRKLVSDGKLSAYLIGEKKLVKFAQEDLDDYLAKCRVENR